MHYGIVEVVNRLTTAIVSENKNLTNLIVEGKELIRMRQKLIRIAHKSADGWRVVDEYVSELAPGSEDEKRLKRAKDAASRKRTLSTQLSSPLARKENQNLSFVNRSAAFSR